FYEYFSGDGLGTLSLYNFSENFSICSVTNNIWDNSSYVSENVTIRRNGSSLAADLLFTGAASTFSTPIDLDISTLDNLSVEFQKTIFSDNNSLDHQEIRFARQGMCGSSGPTGSPLVTLSTDNSTLNENGGSATITAMLSSSASENTVVSLSTSGSAQPGVDFNLPDNLTIYAGNTVGTVNLVINDDNLSEGDESFTVEISSIVGGDNATEYGYQQLSFTIIDDDNFNYTGDPNSNLNTLLSTGNCSGCNLSGIFVDGDNTSLADNVTSVNLANANLSNAHFQNVEFAGDNFSAALLDNASFERVGFFGVDLSQANLSNAHFQNVEFAGDNFRAALLDNASFERVGFFGVQLDAVRGSGLHIQDSLLYAVQIQHANLPESQFDNSSLLYSSIAQTNLTHSGFAKTGLYHTSLDNVSLVGADLRGLYFDNATGSTLDNVSCDNSTLRPSNLSCNAGLLAFNGNPIDDHSNTFDNATSIELGQWKAGYLSPADNDTFVFHLAADNKTTLRLNSEVALHPHLYHDNGTQVFYTNSYSEYDNESEPFSHYLELLYDNLSAGNYFLEVLADNSSETGLFVLSVSMGHSSGSSSSGPRGDIAGQYWGPHQFYDSYGGHGLGTFNLYNFSENFSICSVTNNIWD
ncbi:MAG: pentapeptide repeat-containing protein, partial [bacterium]